jgi:hypothetical protein
MRAMMRMIPKVADVDMVVICATTLISAVGIATVDVFFQRE